jgi:hypothetical protein
VPASSWSCPGAYMYTGSEEAGAEARGGRAFVDACSHGTELSSSSVSVASVIFLPANKIGAPLSEKLGWSIVWCSLFLPCLKLGEHYVPDFQAAAGLQEVVAFCFGWVSVNKSNVAGVAWVRACAN